MAPRLLEILPLSATDGCVSGLVVQSRRRGPLGWAPRTWSRALIGSAPVGSGGFARKGVRPKASKSAKDFLIELPERDTRSMLKTPTRRR